MSVTIGDLHRKFTELAKDGFTGEAVLRFAGSAHEGLHTLHKDMREDTRPEQDIAFVLNIYSLCLRCSAFGQITTIWHKGTVKNYTVRLTFQGTNAGREAEGIFRLGSKC